MTLPWMTPELAAQIIGYAMLAGAIYGGIKADLRAMHQQVQAALHSAARAHERIDNHLEKAP